MENISRELKKSKRKLDKGTIDDGEFFSELTEILRNMKRNGDDICYAKKFIKNNFTDPNKISTLELIIEML